MGIAVLLFSLVVGVFHFQVQETDPGVHQALAVAPAQPDNYSESGGVKTQPAVAPVIESSSPYAALAQAENAQQLAQSVADLVASKPGSASSIVSIAIAQIYTEGTLGEISLIAATATKAAPTEAASIAGAVARSLKGRANPALAAAVATIVSLVPEQSREIGLVVGAVVGDNPAALGMVAQTVAIAVGEETFASLSEGSGVSIAALMKESSSLGVQVPYDVPNYAAQMAPSASLVADSHTDSASQGDM
jgi:hypothetical protein